MTSVARSGCEGRDGARAPEATVALPSSYSESSASSSSGVGEDEGSSAGPRRRRVVQTCRSGRVQACVEVRQSRARRPRSPSGAVTKVGPQPRYQGVVTAAAPAPGSPTVVVDSAHTLRRRPSRCSDTDSDDGDILIKIRSPLISGIGGIVSGSSGTSTAADSIIGIRLRNPDRYRKRHRRSHRSVAHAQHDSAWNTARAALSRAGMRTAGAVGACKWLLATGSKTALRVAERGLSSASPLSRETRGRALVWLTFFSALFGYAVFDNAQIALANWALQHVQSWVATLATWVWVEADWRFLASAIGCSAALAAAGALAAPKCCQQAHNAALALAHKEGMRLEMLELEDKRASCPRSCSRSCNLAGRASSSHASLLEREYPQLLKAASRVLPAYVATPSAPPGSHDCGDVPLRSPDSEITSKQTHIASGDSRGSRSSQRKTNRRRGPSPHQALLPADTKGAPVDARLK